MNKYALLHTPTMGLLAEIKILEGKSGVDALDNYEGFSHLIGRFRRIRAWETPEYCLQRVIERDGQLYSQGSKYWYRYHHPKIDRITAA